MIRTGIGPQAIGRVALQRLSAACGIAVPVLSTIVLLTVNHLHPGYSLTRQRISELGAPGAPYAALLNTAGLGASGLLLVALSLGLYREFRSRSAARIGCVLIGVSGIALVMAGIFPCSVDSAETSVSAIAHGVFARIGEFAIMSAALAMWLGLKGLHNDVEIEVENTGIPISEDEKESIFREHYEASIGTQTRAPGSGVGLMMAKTIVEQFHGDLSISSEPLRAQQAVVTLTVRFPRATAEG